jgi:hypothetical protein
LGKTDSWVYERAGIEQSKGSRWKKGKDLPEKELSCLRRVVEDLIAEASQSKEFDPACLGLAPASDESKQQGRAFAKVRRMWDVSQADVCAKYNELAVKGHDAEWLLQHMVQRPALSLAENGHLELGVEEWSLLYGALETLTGGKSLKASGVSVQDLLIKYRQLKESMPAVEAERERAEIERLEKVIASQRDLIVADDATISRQAELIRILQAENDELRKRKAK